MVYEQDCMGAYKRALKSILAIVDSKKTAACTSGLRQLQCRPYGVERHWTAPASPVDGATIDH